MNQQQSGSANKNSSSHSGGSICASEQQLSPEEQLSRLQEQNQTLQKKLHSKTIENNKLENKVNILESEMSSMKQILEQIKSSVQNGKRPQGEFFGISKNSY